MIPVCVPRRKPAAPLQRHLPPPPKSCARYQHTAPQVDTGVTARHCAQLRQRRRHYYRVRGDEVFRRISAETLMALIVDVQRVMHSAVEEAAAEEAEQPAAAGERHAPYLLLDVRDPTQYAGGHIVTADCFSPSQLSRTAQYDTELMRRYRHRPDAVIVLYDEAETAAAYCATVLTQRGYDNVFVLSGGLRLARTLFPSCVVPTDDDTTGGAEGGGGGRLVPEQLVQRLEEEQQLQQQQCGSVAGGRYCDRQRQKREEDDGRFSSVSRLSTALSSTAPGSGRSGRSQSVATVSRISSTARRLPSVPLAVTDRRQRPGSIAR